MAIFITQQRERQSCSLHFRLPQYIECWPRWSVKWAFSVFAIKFNVGSRLHWPVPTGGRRSGVRAVVNYEAVLPL